MSAGALHEVAAASGPVSSDLENLKVHPTGLRETIRIVCEAHTSAKKPLPHYRVYFLDEDGHRAFAQDLAAADDREAVKKARQLLDRQDVELWDGERLVGRSDHDRPWTE